MAEGAARERAPTEGREVTGRARLALDERGEVVVVPGEDHLTPGRELGPQGLLELPVQERQLQAAHLLRVVGQHAPQGVPGEVAPHGGVEHLPEEVQQHLALGGVDHVRVEAHELLLARAAPGEPGLGEEDRDPAAAADEAHLLDHSAGQRVQVGDRPELVRGGRANEAVLEGQRTRALDEGAGAVPAQLEALGRVHGLGHAHAAAVDALPEGEGRVPVDVGRDLVCGARMLHRVRDLRVARQHGHVGGREAAAGQRCGPVHPRLEGREHRVLQLEGASVGTVHRGAHPSLLQT